MALSFAVLEALHTPASVEALARRLAVPAPHVRIELDRLAGRGYVARLDGVADGAPPRSRAACAGCGFRAACGGTPEERWGRVDSSHTTVVAATW